MNERTKSLQHRATKPDIRRANQNGKGIGLIDDPFIKDCSRCNGSGEIDWCHEDIFYLEECYICDGSGLE